MNPPRSIPRGLCWLVFGAGWLLAARCATAQQQDRLLFDRVMRPNMELHAEGFGKAYEPAASGENKSFLTRLFGGSHPASTKAGSGTFYTSGFTSGKGGYAAEGFSTRKAAVGGQPPPQFNRGYESKSVDVKEDRAAGKAATIQNYEPSGKAFSEKGKRQDTIDDLRREKNLTIDQVREILNKNK